MGLVTHLDFGWHHVVCASFVLVMSGWGMRPFADTITVHLMRPVLSRIRKVRIRGHAWRPVHGVPRVDRHPLCDRHVVIVVIVLVAGIVTLRLVETTQIGVLKGMRHPHGHRTEGLISPRVQAVVCIGAICASVVDADNAVLVVKVGIRRWVIGCLYDTFGLNDLGADWGDVVWTARMHVGERLGVAALLHPSLVLCSGWGRLVPLPVA